MEIEEEAQSLYQVSRSRFENGGSRTRMKMANHYNATFDDLL
jgi:hypothetical protein